MFRWFRQGIQDNSLIDNHELPSSLCTVFAESRKLVQFTKSVNKKIFRPQHIEIDEATDTSSVPHLPVHATTPCSRCQDLPPEQHCHRTFLVDRMANAAQYENAVLTEADPHDRLKPKVCIYLTSVP